MKEGIVFFGVKLAGKTALITLIEQKIIIRSIITMGGKENYAIADIARQIGVPFHKNPKLKDESFQAQLEKYSAKIGLCVSYPRIIPKIVLELFPQGILNLHPARLPQHRGCFPTVWPILHGEDEADYTLHVMDQGIDSGPIIDKETVNFGDNDTGWSLYERLLNALPILLVRNASCIKNGINKAKPQDENKACYHNKKLPNDGNINWEWSADKIVRFVRALYSPVHTCAQGNIEGQKREIRRAVSINSFKKQLYNPGTIIEEGENLTIACGDGIVKILDMTDFNKTKSIIDA